ncbi:MAG TPA: hypothetical protein VFB34_13230 [Chloroflexota bacterium]|nr:hypothetical protein [Chloroflexota bacterium]
MNPFAIGFIILGLLAVGVIVFIVVSANRTHSDLLRRRAAQVETRSDEGDAQ